MNKEIPHNPLEGEKPELNIPLNTSNSEMVSIIIVHKDQTPYLNIALQTIAVCSFNNNYEIIVVDNGSGQDSQDFLTSIEKEVKVVRNEQNLHFSEAANRGAQVADRNSQYLVFMHCDVNILNPAWLDLLTNICNSNNAGLVGVEMKSYVLSGKKVDFINDWLLMMSKECWKDCGPFPKELPIIGNSFILTLKAQQHGYQPQVLKSAIAHHYRIFSFDISEFERLNESAMTTIPKLIKQVQSESVKRVI